GVSEARPGNAVDAREGVMTNRRIAVSRAGARTGEYDRDARGCVEVANSRVAVAGNDVVATQSFELVKAAIAVADVEQRRIEMIGVHVASGVEMIDEKGALNTFYRAQRVVADRIIADARRRSGGQIHGDASGRRCETVVAGNIEAA